MGSTRIFLVNTCLSTLFAALHAKENPNPDGTDVLLIDKLRVRPSEKKLILDAASLHGFGKVIDFSSELGEAQSYAPSLKKRLTRKYKEKALIKPFYMLLLNVANYFAARKEKVKLETEIGIARRNSDQVRLYLLPHKQLTPVIQSLYPQADCYYTEHGLGDYYDIQKLSDDKMKFLCLFNDSFLPFLKSKNEERIHTQRIFSSTAFGEQADVFNSLFPQISKITDSLPQQDQLVLILIQPFEQQQIPLAFWDFFLDESLKQLPSTEGRCFLIKPHPKQAAEVTQYVLEYFNKKGLSALVWDTAELRSLSVEIIFTCLQDKVEFVFSPSSSSIFYLPVLFPESKAQFYWSLRFVIQFAEKTSPMFKDRWIKALPLFEEVFGSHAKELHTEEGE